MQIQPQFPISRPASQSKEMISIDHSGPKPKIRINSSSLETLQTCKRKAYYSLFKEYRSHQEGEALIFGRAIHAALEYWYSLLPQERIQVAQSEAFTRFGFEAGGLLLADEGKRSAANGIKILSAYFEHYKDDDFTTYHDLHGPFVERDFSFTLIDLPSFQIDYFGRIDAALVHQSTGDVVLVDHKTASILGQDFYNRSALSFQFIGYLLGAQHLGVPTRTMMVNGIQVAKTKQEFVRHFVDLTQDKIDEFKRSVLDAAHIYLEKGQFDDEAYWPMTTPNPCVAYGGCTYRSICEAPSSLRPTIIESYYGEKHEVK